MALTGGVWEAQSLLMRSVPMLYYTQSRVERVDWECKGGCCVFCDCLSPCPSLSHKTTEALIASRCTYTLEQRQYDWGKILTTRCSGCSNPKQHLSREGAAITGVYTGSTSEAVQISDRDQTDTAHPVPCWVPMPVLLLQHCFLLAGRELMLVVGRAHTWRELSWLGPTLKASAPESSLGTDPAPWGSDGHWT